MKIRSLAFALLSLVPPAALSAADDAAALLKRFEEPTPAARPMVRWWWFGPAVTKPQLEREMTNMKLGGFGGFEVQSTYPLAVDGAVPGLKNLKFLSPEHLDAIKFTAAKAKELGLRMDLTLGSGWPYGGPMFTRAEAAGRLGTQAFQLAPGQTRVGLPNLRAGESIAGAVVGPVAGTAPGESPYRAAVIKGNAVEIPAGTAGATQIIFYISGQTGMQVKRPAFGAEGNVIDHYSDTVVNKFIKEIAAPALEACAPNMPYAVFCDSLEVNGEDWTPGFLTDFKRLRGYDLTPWLPALFDNSLPRSAEVHHDWGQTLTDLFNEHFSDILTKFAQDHGTKFRLQAYGSPAASFNSYAHVNLPEGEGPNWRAFASTRWASSASHILGQNVTSSETWTWLHQAVFVANPLDMKAEADTFFLQGINQLIGHGWPGTADNIPYPGWRFYAAGVLNDKNPWFIAMPDVTKYLTRVSAMLREGRPANDVLLYLPEDDAWAGLAPGRISMSDALGRMVSPFISGLLDRGYNLDFCDGTLLEQRGQVDGGALVFGDVPYKVVVLPSTQRATAATMRKLEAFVQGGGILVAVQNPPSLAPGLAATAADQAAVREISDRLFRGAGAKGLVVDDVAHVASAIQERLKPDVALFPVDPFIGFVHRHAEAGEIYFLANTANTPKHGKVTCRVAGLTPEWWNPVTGRTDAVTGLTSDANGTTVDFDLPAYGSQLLVFSKSILTLNGRGRVQPAGASPAPIDLSTGWDVTFKNANPAGHDPAPARLDAGTSWAADPARQYFSGTGSYVKQVTLPAAWTDGRTVKLAFNGGSAPTGGGAGARGGSGTHATYTPPVREAAVVYVNGQRAGAAWCPPYQVELTGLLKAGVNEIKVVVGNLATNDMSTPGHWDIDTRALDATFGNRFSAQGMNLVQVYPSGITGTVQLVATQP